MEKGAMLMRKFFCSIGIFFFLCLLTLGFYSSYMRTYEKNHKNPTRLSVEDITEGETVSASEEEGSYGLFLLKERNGCVTVYEGDGVTVYEPTTIPVKTLPKTLQQEIKQGKYLKTHGDLYSFLENYSS